MLVNYLAEVWGISMVFISLALLIKPDYLKILFTEVEKDATLFFWGIISVVIGLAMVLSYNVWEQSWRVIITIFGWASLLKGVGTLFFPQFIRNWTRKFSTASFLPFVLLVALFIGLALTYFGFTK